MRLGKLFLFCAQAYTVQIFVLQTSDLQTEGQFLRVNFVSLKTACFDNPRRICCENQSLGPKSVFCNLQQLPQVFFIASAKAVLVLNLHANTEAYDAFQKQEQKV